MLRTRIVNRYNWIITVCKEKKQHERTVEAGDANVKFLSCYYYYCYFFFRSIYFYLKLRKGGIVHCKILFLFFCLKFRITEHWNKICFTLTFNIAGKCLKYFSWCSCYSFSLVSLTCLSICYIGLKSRFKKIDKQLYSKNSENFFAESE